MQATRLHTLLLASFLFSTTVSAQVFDSGPSDPAMFTAVLNISDDSSITGIGAIPDLTLQVNIAAGGSLGNFFTAEEGIEVNINGGAVGGFFSALDGSELNLTEGSLGGAANFFGGSEVNISGGGMGVNGSAREGSVVNLSGGRLGFTFDAESGSEINISGGIVGDFFDAQSGSEVNISGGELGRGFTAFENSNVNLIGSAFAIDGVLLSDLAQGEAFNITERNVTLSGLLADNTAFSFFLNDDFNQTSIERFSPGATLTVTPAAVPEPTSPAILLLGCGLAGIRRRRSAP